MRHYSNEVTWRSTRIRSTFFWSSGASRDSGPGAIAGHVYSGGRPDTSAGISDWQLLSNGRGLLAGGFSDGGLPSQRGVHAGGIFQETPMQVHTVENLLSVEVARSESDRKDKQDQRLASDRYTQ